MRAFGEVLFFHSHVPACMSFAEFIVREAAGLNLLSITDFKGTSLLEICFVQEGCPFSKT